MKLGDIYVNKENESIIQIDSFATHMAKPGKDTIIIFRQIEKHNEFEIGSCPSLMDMEQKKKSKINTSY
ncbi:MAG: hypothetical protein ACLUQX_03310 [Thomasclavelia spiroformis]